MVGGHCARSEARAGANKGQSGASRWVVGQGEREERMRRKKEESERE